MRKLPLYAAPPRGVLELESPLALNHTCSRCALGTAKIRTICMAADGESGGLLVVGQAPGRDEDVAGRPMVGKSGSYLRVQIAKHWKGPVAYDNAARCFTPEEPKPATLKACRPYLAQTLREARPQRILALGAVAAKSIIGRAISPMLTRRAYAYLHNPGVPVFVLLHPAAAVRNRFVRTMFEQDLEWALTSELPARAPIHAEIRLVEDLESARACDTAMRLGPWFSFDVEAAGVMWEPSYRILAVSCCIAGEDSPWVWTAKALTDPSIRTVLLELLGDPHVRKGGQNVKYDMLAFRAAYGQVVKGIDFDIRLERKLIEPEASGYLEDMVELIGMGGTKEECDVVKTAEVAKAKATLRSQKKEAASKNKTLFPTVGQPLHPRLDAALEALVRDEDDDEPDRYAYALLPDDVLWRYNGRDAVSTTRLASKLGVEVAANPALSNVWSKIVLPASSALERVEAWGMGASRDAILAFDSYCAIQEMEASAKLQGHAQINWGSNVQVADYFYKQRGYSIPFMSASGQSASVDEDALKHLEAQGAREAAALLKLREMTKLRGTYAAGMLRHIRSDGRIHPNVKLDGARSGRTSCTDPNLQNIPRAETLTGKMIRQCFIAPPGYALLESDYSQLELRIAAMLSGDPDMKAIFQSGVDYHLRTAQMISKLAWGIAPEDVKPQHRSAAKTINFALLYGQGDAACAAKITVEMRRGDPGAPAVRPEQAAKVREAILGKFKVLARWLEDQLTFARRYGHSRTWWEGKPGRSRPLWRIADQDDQMRSNAENASQNTPIQGTASDYCIASLARVVDWIEEEHIPAKLIIPIHDSLMLEVREDYLAEAAYCVRGIMQGHWSDDVLLEVDQKVGPNWGDLQKYKEAA